MTTIINGKAAAATIIDATRNANAELGARTGRKTGLAVIIVGDDPASHAYVGAKSRMAKDCGFLSVQHTLPKQTTQQELAALVHELNGNDSIHGILVQLPCRNISTRRPLSSRSGLKRTSMACMSSTRERWQPEI